MSSPPPPPNDLSNILVLTVLFYTSQNTTLRNSILVLGMLALAKKQSNGIKLSKRYNIWMWRHEYNSQATTYRQG
ncbi:hypothetical protein [Xylella fastidiosa]|uniref:hypothetical protein n=1 Tax=Xylella fastidiosa TaxID=2371 RepID=UPI001F43C3B5|nr:hypothetical protein [Xylella fastidiosa]